MRTPNGMPLAERILRRSETDASGCWIWRGHVDPGGYGRLWFSGRMRFAHRASYSAFNGPIPPGMTVDHLCFTTACVNPEHLRLLTIAANAANQRKALSDRCARGHEYTPENTAWQPDRRDPARGPHRTCRACRRERERANKKRKRVAA